MKRSLTNWTDLQVVVPARASISSRTRCATADALSRMPLSVSFRHSPSCDNRSELYPFECDFYIPELDLYIEYQGYKTHGKEPYNPDNPEHIKLVEEYKKRAEEINFKDEKKVQYLRYINVWTVRDPLKRETARKNELNYIEFFNMKQFMEWFNKL